MQKFKVVLLYVIFFALPFVMLTVAGCAIQICAFSGNGAADYRADTDAARAAITFHVGERKAK